MKSWMLEVLKLEFGEIKIWIFERENCN